MLEPSCQANTWPKVFENLVHSINIEVRLGECLCARYVNRKEYKRQNRYGCERFDYEEKSLHMRVH